MWRWINVITINVSILALAFAGAVGLGSLLTIAIQFLDGEIDE